jgi:trehalose 6-phosphate synthase
MNQISDSPHISSDAASFVVVANRLPIDVRIDDEGDVHWEESPGGLVSALAPVLHGREAVWIGWSGVATEVDAIPAFRTPAMMGSYHLVDVPLSASMVEQYYEGFSNSTLWPLYHDRIVAPEYHRDTWNAYVEVNLHFAEHTADVAAPNATVWVHDYQLQLVPSMLRALRPDLLIGFYLHIPFPPAELFLQLPWRQRIVEGMLGADLIGFQTPFGANNFCEVTSQLMGYESDSASADGGWIDVGTPSFNMANSVQFRPARNHVARRVQVDAFPISIDVASLEELAASPKVQQRALDIRRDLGDPKFLLLGVDRMDYTKGIEVRLRAFVELLEDDMLDPAHTVLLQIATPSREQVQEYQRLREDIELLVGRAAGALGEIGQVPLRYMYSGLPRAELAAFYVAADVMLVTPLRDGMNLVAKEYVATRIDDSGGLVLSEFAGAALELPQAWLVNPYSLESVKEAIMTALGTTPEDRRRRMAAMRTHLREHDVERWAREFLDALAATGS